MEGSVVVKIGVQEFEFECAYEAGQWLNAFARLREDIKHVDFSPLNPYHRNESVKSLLYDIYAFRSEYHDVALPVELTNTIQSLEVSLARAGCYVVSRITGFGDGDNRFGLNGRAREDIAELAELPIQSTGSVFIPVKKRERDM